MPGMVLGGRYQVQDRIGTGGMATVFRGQDEVLGRTVAIKTMLPQYATDPSFAARFKQEAQAAAALQSPYIVSVYDWGKDADTYYIVMEYLRGTDLKSGIRKHGALDCKKVAQIGSQIAQALSVAHRHDIIHRDIKPQNIMVQPDGNIKVMDFGIARAKNSHLTQDNSVLGTAHYVSPEQTQGKELGPTTDIYSLGIVMYEAATGQVPFQGDDAISVALKQVNEQPKPPSQLNPAIDPSLESIILKCMQKDPAARFQTADELYRALRDYLAGRLQAVNNATAMLPAQPTNKLERGAGVVPASNSTAAMPRVERTGRFRPQSATAQAAEEEAARQNRRRKNIIIGAVAGVVVVAAIIFAVVNMLGAGSKMVTMPNLLGYTQEQAIQAVEGAGLKVKEVKTRYDDSTEKGRVCDQDPLANRQVPEGREVTIYISDGQKPAEEVTVPDLTNMTEEQARKALLDLNLQPQRGDDVDSDDVDEGKVAEQSPAAGQTAKAGDSVTYHLSSGAGDQVIPDVEGDSEASARSRLEEAGFVVKVETASSSTVSKGNVISTTPGKGSTAKKGSTVTITVSSGAGDVTIPSGIIGMSESQATAKLKELGFTVRVTTAPSSSSAHGTVIGVSPNAGSSAAYGSTVTITVSSGMDSVDVPDVVGKAYSEAKAQLEALGFSVRLAGGSSTESGVVVSQSETGSAQQGATIYLTTQ